MRRVLLLTDGAAAPWRWSVDLARQFSRRGLEVILAAAGDALTPWQAWEAKGMSGIDLREAPPGQARTWLTGLDLRAKADVVHLVGCPRFAVLPWRAPLVTTVCDVPATETEWGELIQAVRSSHQAVSPARALAAAVESRYSGPPSWSVIRHTCEGSQFRPGIKERFILSTARPSDPAEDLAALEWVAPHLRWPVLCTLGMLPAPELADWYSRAPLFVLPARRKTFSLSALEAALSGCALVLTNLPGLREVWEDDAVYVPPGDRLALGAALTDLIHHPSRRHDLGDRAAERARSFRLQEMTDCYLNAYHEAVRAAGRSGLASAV